MISFGIVTTTTGPVRLIAGLSLLCAFAFAIWLFHQARFSAIVPATGLTLAFLILAGLATAAVHALSAVAIALVLGVVALAAAWASVVYQPESAERKPGVNPPNWLAIAGLLIAAVIAVLAIRYAAVSATADANDASSLAVWAYPSGDRLQVGVQQPPGHPAASLRIVVTQAGTTVAAWNNVQPAPGQTWKAPALTLTGNGPVQVIVLHSGTVMARLSVSPRAVTT